MFARNPFDFERWAVSLVDGTPNEKQVGDKGSDGLIRFPVDSKASTGRAVVSVKGGAMVNPSMVRDLVGTVEQTKADMGIFICMTKPTPGMAEVAAKSGDYAWPVDGRKFPGCRSSPWPSCSTAGARRCRHRSCPTSRHSAWWMTTS